MYCIFVNMSICVGICVCVHMSSLLSAMFAEVEKMNIELPKDTCSKEKKEKQKGTSKNKINENLD